MIRVSWLIRTNFLIEDIDSPNRETILLRDIQLLGRSRDHVVTHDGIVPLELWDVCNWHYHNDCRHKFGINEILGTHSGLNNDICKISNSIVSFFQSVLSQLGPGLSICIDPGSQLRLEVTQFCLDDLSDPRQSVTSGVF